MNLFYREFFKFLVVGGLGFMSNLIFAYIFTDIFGLWYIASFVISALMTWTGMFFGNLFFTFREEVYTGYLGKYVSFIAGYSVLFLFNLTIVFFLTSVIGLYYLLSISIGTIFTTVLTFLYSKFFVFRLGSNKSKRYFIALFIFLAFLVGSVNVLPHIVRLSLLSPIGAEYYPYSLVAEYDATNVIGPRIKEVLEGNLLPSDIDLYEYRDAPSFWPPLPPLFYVFFGLFTSSVTKAVIIADFVFPSIFFILFYVLFYTISERKYVSLWFATLTSLYVYFSIQIPPSSVEVLRMVWNTFFPLSAEPYAYFLTRKESFIPTLVTLLLFFIFSFRAIKTRHKKDIIFAGVFYALNAYAYPYHFIYASASVSIFFLLSGIIYVKNKNFKDTLWLKNIGLFVLTAGIVLIPFISNQIELRGLPQYTEILGKFGIEIGRSFRFEHSARYAIFLVLSGLIYVWSKRNQDRRGTALFAISILFAGIAVLNMQMVLGFSVQSDHWLNRDLLWGMTIAYFIVGVWLYDFLRARLKRPWVLKTVGILLLVCLCINSIRYQYILAEDDYMTRTISKYFTDAFMWLNQHTEKDSVVMTPSLVSNYFLPLYTHNKIFVPRTLNSVASEAEILERLFISYKVFGVTKDHLSQVLEEEKDSANTFDNYERFGTSYLFAFKYMSKDLKTYTGSLNTNIVPEVEKEHIVKDFVMYECKECLDKFRADYIFVGPQEKGFMHSRFNESGYLEEVYSSSDVQIYRITHANFSL